MTDEVAAIQRNDTVFGGRIADRTVNRLDLPSTYKANTERYKLTVNGTEDREFDDAAFTDQPAKYQLTAGDGDTIEWASRERLRYVPNYEALWGIAAWYETTADQLTDGQRLFIELSDDGRENVYGYEFTPGNTRQFLRSGGQLIDERTQAEWRNDPLDVVDRDQPLNPRTRVGWYGAAPAGGEIIHTSPSDSGPRQPQTGFVHNPDDIATEEINLRLRVVAEADPGAPNFTVNIGSMGGLIRGGAIEFDRPKAGLLYDLGGSIGDTWAGNAPVLAVRHDTDQRNVAAKIEVPDFSPSGDVTMELLLGAVGPNQTDATGFAPLQQSQTQNTALEATTNVSTFPTVTRDVPDASTQVEVPDVRQLAHSVAEGAKNDVSKAEAGPGENNKRTLGPDEVALFIPRTAGSTGATINWLRPVSTQDW